MLLRAGLTLGLLLFPAAGAVAETPSSGIAGRVLVDSCPGPEEPGERCARPAALPIVVKRNSRAVLRTRSNADGRFRVALQTGRYVVRATSAGRPPRIAQKTVVVPLRGYARVVLRVDLGIR